MDASRKPLETRPERMEPLARLPVFLALDGKRVVLVGGGQAAAWKRGAAGGGRRARRRLRRRTAWTAERSARRGDRASAPSRMTRVPRPLPARRAARVGVPVNVIDKPAFCDFAFGAIVNRSPLVIGISTDGAAPVFAQAIRAKLEALLPKGFADWASAAARWRNAVKASGLSFAGRRKFWQAFTAHAVSQSRDASRRKAISSGCVAEVKGLGTAVENGSVTLVGAGPGDPELLTLRAVRALQSADVILFDDLVSREVLDFARREARKMLVGKTGFGPSCKQDDINALMVSSRQTGQARGAAQGRRPADLRPGRRGDRRLQGGRYRRRDRARHHGGAGCGGQARHSAHRPQACPPAAIRHRPRQERPTARRSRLASLADPATTTAIYMPTRTLERSRHARRSPRGSIRRRRPLPSRAPRGPIRRWSPRRSRELPSAAGAGRLARPRARDARTRLRRAHVEQAVTPARRHG